MATALARSSHQRPLAQPAVRSRQRTVSVRAAKKTAVAYVCIDCGWIYDGREPFEKLPSSYRCPVCSAPKRRFRATEAKGRSNDASAMRKRYDAMQRGENDGKFDENDKSFFIAAAVGGAVLLGGLYAYLSAQTAL